MNKIGGGLREPEHDISRDFNFGSIFKVAGISTLPKEYRVSEPLLIKNQDVVPASDVCVGAATSAVLEDHEGVPLSMEFQFSATKRISGNPNAYGATLKDGATSAVQIGAVAIADFPFSLEKQGRDFFAQPNTIPTYFDSLAENHKQLSYFAADKGQNDIFDNIRQTMWGVSGEKSSALSGALWRPEWTYSKKGMIPKEYTSFGDAHAFKIFGWECLSTKSDDDVLLLQLSNGTEIGDGGIFRMPRSVVNRELTYGNYCFKDVLREYAEFHQANNLKADDPTLCKIIAFIVGLFRKR